MYVWIWVEFYYFFSLGHRIGCGSHSFKFNWTAASVHVHRLRHNHLHIGWISYFLWHTVWNLKSAGLHNAAKTLAHTQTSNGIANGGIIIPSWYVSNFPADDVNWSPLHVSIGFGLLRTDYWIWIETMIHGLYFLLGIWTWKLVSLCISEIYSYSLNRSYLSYFPHKECKYSFTSVLSEITSECVDLALPGTCKCSCRALYCPHDIQNCGLTNQRREYTCMYQHSSLVT